MGTYQFLPHHRISREAYNNVCCFPLSEAHPRHPQLGYLAHHRPRVFRYWMIRGHGTGQSIGNNRNDQGGDIGSKRNDNRGECTGKVWNKK